MSITATVAATTVTMVLVLAMGILVGYFCRIKKRLEFSYTISTVSKIKISKIKHFKGIFHCPTVLIANKTFLNLCLHQQLKFDISLYFIHAASD